MGKKKSSRVNDPILVKIEQAFQRFRRQQRGGRRYYLSDLQELAVMAVRGGKKAEVVARSAGVSKASVFSWLKKHREKPQELEIVAAPAAVLPVLSSCGKTVMTARIYLLSGAVIELPVGAITSSLVGALGGGGAL
jgi:hypothetical protein